MRGSTGQLDKEANLWHISRNAAALTVSATYQDEHGKSCDKWESFPTKEEAVKRQKQIEHELATGNFLIPSTVTVAEFLMDWLPKQCSKHKWAPKTYESNLSTIQNLIIPYIGSMEMQKLKPYHMENLYTTLSKTPCGSYVEGKKLKISLPCPASLCTSPSPRFAASIRGRAAARKSSNVSIAGKRTER